MIPTITLVTSPERGARLGTIIGWTLTVEEITATIDGLTDALNLLTSLEDRETSEAQGAETLLDRVAARIEFASLNPGYARDAAQALIDSGFVR